MKHLPRKRFGQNFLKDPSVLDKIIAAIAPAASDIMVEIGPGMGAMTGKLLPSLSRLEVIELDRDLVVYLRNTFPPEKLVVHQGDALAFDMRSLKEQSGEKIRIVGNLPYNISTPLLFHLLEFSLFVKDQHFMLQREVVERMVAEPGSKAYGRLSVMLQWQYDMDMLFIVPPEAFDPQPKVDSAVVRMIPKENPEKCSFPALEKTVTQAFSQRRKMLRNNLAPFFTEAELTGLGIEPTKRPEELSVEQFIRLANHLK
ncbi:16S rRNA (adenine(1518)-N(6)/adenine(1519)-N(6))-dimethyltransferase RsmA [Oxalobacter paraformigenes]|uniref:Ribosomal RNA small subunit methyltransferase A n=1 Tax=Oxalobacter paraformigenes TaxID=556268 RepID=C3X570_9BURK|nr:16S rRNA (adenine(1518)-N(6)/adenine(1519)-N(6))-dimethyltransferase RsmA [Oxalobacter paraformigenes]EEO28356.1 dimethyladenosine transferase [Oxalobacter paraformigenes]